MCLQMIIFIASCSINQVFSIVNMPEIACPQYFRYEQIDGVNVGMFEIPYVDVNPIILGVSFSQKPPENSDGANLWLYPSKENAIMQIKTQKPITYRVDFPVPTKLPKLTMILINNRTICSNTGYMPPSNTFTLWHRLKTRVVSSSGSTSEQPLPSCGQEGEFDRFSFLIVGGSEVQPGQYPWLAAISIEFASKWEFQCGGSLISGRTVLTAAHCFLEQRHEVTSNIVSVQLGRHNILKQHETGGVSLAVESYKTHPDYKRQRLADADVAIVVMERLVEFTERIGPICLWTDSHDLELLQGQSGIVAGWGKDENEQITEKPKRLTVPIVSTKTCTENSLHYYRLTSERTICAGGLNGNGPCMGDSGGPLMLKRSNRWFLRGVVSIGPSRCNANEYTIYTDVAKFRSWIDENII